jgi:hypothetical protein
VRTALAAGCGSRGLDGIGSRARTVARRPGRRVGRRQAGAWAGEDGDRAGERTGAGRACEGDGQAVAEWHASVAGREKVDLRSDRWGVGVDAQFGLSPYSFVDPPLADES